MDSLPNDLPQALSSPLLSAFLRNVRLQLEATRLKLDECYRLLFVASEEVWRFQLEQETRRQSTPHSWRQDAQAFRDELRNNRRYRFETAGKRVPLALAPKDIRALQEMGLDTLPTYKELRHQFLTLAKKRHPDIKGGSEEAFKNLRAAFQHLSQRVR